MAETRTKWRIPRNVVAAIAIVFAAAIAVGATLAIQDRKDEAITEETTRAESNLKELGAQISAVKDADLASMNDFIAAYAQVEPLEKEYDQKLQKFTELYRTAKDRDSHRSLLDLQRPRGRHHPESWEKMSQIIELVRQINNITKARNINGPRHVVSSGARAGPVLARTVHAPSGARARTALRTPDRRPGAAVWLRCTVDSNLFSRRSQDLATAHLVEL